MGGRLICGRHHGSSVGDLRLDVNAEVKPARDPDTSACIGECRLARPGECNGIPAAPDAGFGYFATAKHYRHLAKGVLDAFHRGGLVLVTGDPPVCLPMLTEELRKSTPRAVVVISCGPALDCRELLARDMPAADLPPPGGVEGEGSGRSAKPNPICLFDDADRLSDAQIETILDAAHAARPDARALKPGVLVASAATLNLTSPLTTPQGTFANNIIGNRTFHSFYDGSFGMYGTFKTTSPPYVEVLSVLPDTTASHEGYMRLVRIGDLNVQHRHDLHHMTRHPGAAGTPSGPVVGQIGTAGGMAPTAAGLLPGIMMPGSTRTIR